MIQGPVSVYKKGGNRGEVEKKGRGDKTRFLQDRPTVKTHRKRRKTKKKRIG